jgi:hypothetical protein
LVERRERDFVKSGRKFLPPPYKYVIAKVISLITMLAFAKLMFGKIILPVNPSKTADSTPLDIGIMQIS